MKKSCYCLLFIVFIKPAWGQIDYNNLPSDFSKIAAEAFTRIQPTTLKWFDETVVKHPQGDFSTEWTRQKIKERFGSTSKEDLFVVMMAYKKILNKEAREDRKLNSSSKDLSIAAKEQKLEADNKAFDQMKNEAKEKADNKMDAANIAIASSAASAGAQIAGGQLSSAGTNSSVKPDSAVSKYPSKYDNRSVMINKAKSSSQLRPEDKLRQEMLKKVQNQLSELITRKDL